MAADPETPLPAADGVDFAWPPVGDLEIVAIADLDAPTIATLGPTTAHSATPEARPAVPPATVAATGPVPVTLRSPLGIHEISVEATRHPGGSRRRGLWLLPVGLALLELSEVYSPRVSAPAPKAATPLVEAGSSAVVLATPLAGSPASAANQRRRPVEPEVEPEREPEPRRSVRPRPARLLAAATPGASPIEPEAHLSVVGESSVTAVAPAASGAAALPPPFVPARAIGRVRPPLVPAPFPLPRGARTSLELVIDEGGHVASARIAVSGAGYYNQPLLAAARRWRFEPARLGGKPTRSTHTVDVALQP